MRALEPEVSDAVWAAIEPLLPVPADEHPLGCHRQRVSNQLCFRGILIRLVTGASWVDIEAILDFAVSDTTLRARRDEWINAGVFDDLVTEALAAFDRIIGLDLGDVALDGSLHKAPYGGEGTGPNPTDRAKLGWKCRRRVDDRQRAAGHSGHRANEHNSTPSALDHASDELVTRGDGCHTVQLHEPEMETRWRGEKLGTDVCCSSVPHEPVPHRDQQIRGPASVGASSSARAGRRFAPCALSAWVEAFPVGQQSLEPRGVPWQS